MIKKNNCIDKKYLKKNIYIFILKCKCPAVENIKWVPEKCIRLFYIINNDLHPRSLQNYLNRLQFYIPTIIVLNQWWAVCRGDLNNKLDIGLNIYNYLYLRRNAFS